MNEEDRLTIWLMDHVRRAYPERVRSFFHIPNGGKRSKKTAGLLARMGVQSGVSDFHCTIPRGGYHSLWLEIKTNKGTLKPEQRDFLDEQIVWGHFAVVTYGAEQALTVINRWLGFEPVDPIDWMMEIRTPAARQRHYEEWLCEEKI